MPRKRKGIIGDERSGCRHCGGPKKTHCAFCSDVCRKAEQQRRYSPKAYYRLAAAAPDLLAALIRLTKWDCLGSHYNLGSNKVKADLTAARAAITQAQAQA